MRAQRLLIALAVVALAVASTGAWAGGGEINLWYGQKNLDLKSQASDYQSEFSDGERIGSDTFSDLEDLTQFGLMTSWGLDWPVAIAADLFYGSSDASTAYSYSYSYNGGRGSPYYYTYTERIDIDYKVLELDVGVRKYWGGKVEFFIGGGLAIASADVEANGVETFSGFIPARGSPPSQTSFSDSDSGSDFGLWADVGFVWRAGEHFNLGLDVRYSSVNVDLSFDDDPDETPLRFPAGGTQIGLFVGGRW